ncbi:hypothetical protein ACOM2C_03495 [Pseudarthrobacter sp. So.54]
MSCVRTRDRPLSAPREPGIPRRAPGPAQTGERLDAHLDLLAQQPSADRLCDRPQPGRAASACIFPESAVEPALRTVRADQLAINRVLEAVDVRWWSHSPVRAVFVVTEISPPGTACWP